MALYVLEWRFGADRAARLEVRPDHRSHLEELHARGSVRAAGPWADDTGAMIVYSAADQDELERLLERDPYVVSGAGGDRLVREWKPFLGARLADASGSG